MTENNTKTIDARTKIMSSALELFKQYGFKSVTMDDVARRAGISKKTLYQFFDNKNSIVSETLLWYKQTLRCQCNDMMDGAKDAIEAFVRIQVHFENFYKEINPIALHELQRFYPEGYHQFRENINNDVSATKNNIDQGIAEGFYRPDINSEILARFHMESIIMTMTSATLITNRYDLFAVTREVMEHFIYGILNAKGIKLYEKYKAQYQTTS